MIRGIKTSEFWLSLATAVMGALGLSVPTATGQSPSATALGLFASGAAAVVAYVAARAHVKAATVRSGASAAQRAVSAVVADIDSVTAPAPGPSGSQVVAP